MDNMKSQDATSISQSLIDFNVSPEIVLKILEENYKFLLHRSAKIQFTKLKNKLQTILDGSPSKD